MRNRLSYAAVVAAFLGGMFVIVPTVAQGPVASYDSSGNLLVKVNASGTATPVTAAGAVASGATDSGNPVKVAGKYNSSPITLTDGQRGDLQLDASGYAKVNIAAGGSTTVTEGATITAGQSNAALTSAVIFGFDGTTNSRVAAKGSTPASNAVGMVTRPLLSTDGTNTQPAMDAMARAAFTKSIPFGDGALASGAVTSAMTGTTSTSVIGGTASNYVYVTQCTTSNASTTVSTDILLQDGSGGTTLYVLPDPAAATATTGGGGGAFSFPVPLKVTTSGNGLFAANVTTGSSTKISCSGFKSTTSY